jgi:hypothetical protein
MLAQDMLPGRFDRLGMRVPFIVVSPFAKRAVPPELPETTVEPAELERCRKAFP